MYLTKEKKEEIFKKSSGDAKNTGSSESQISLFTYRISHLTEHLKKNKKDYGTRRSLISLVNKRKKLLTYLKNTNLEKYNKVATAVKE